MTRGTGQPHKEQDTTDRDVNTEDEEGVEHGSKRMTWSNTIRRRQLPCNFNCQCRRDETRRGRTRTPLEAGRHQKKPDEGEDEAVGESPGRRRSRRPRKEEEDQRSPMPACHMPIRSDGKADEEAKYQEGEYQENEEEEILPQKAHSSDLTSSGLCAKVQDSTLCGVLLIRGNPPSKHFFSTKDRVCAFAER